LTRSRQNFKNSPKTENPRSLRLSGHLLAFADVRHPVRWEISMSEPNPILTRNQAHLTGKDQIEMAPYYHLGSEEPKESIKLRRMKVTKSYPQLRLGGIREKEYNISSGKKWEIIILCSSANTYTP